MHSSISNQTDHDSLAPLDELQKRAYRRLLYLAMLDIRRIAPIADQPMRRLLNSLGFSTAVKPVARAAAVADWLHNLAYFSSTDFAGFQQELFWSQHAQLALRYPELDWYRSEFNHATASNGSSDPQDSNISPH